MALAEEGLELAEAWGGASAHACALRAAALHGDPALRLERLEAAKALVAPTGVRLEHAVTLCELGAELRRAGRRGAAAEALHKADDLARAAGAGAARGPHPRGARRGGRPAAGSPLQRHGLPDGERAAVAELAAAGRSNKEIARA